MFLNIVISVEDCFEILVGMKPVFSASGLRHKFEMAHSGGLVNRDLPIFAHGVLVLGRVLALELAGNKPALAVPAQG